MYTQLTRSLMTTYYPVSKLRVEVGGSTYLLTQHSAVVIIRPGVQPLLPVGAHAKGAAARDYVFKVAAVIRLVPSQ